MVRTYINNTAAFIDSSKDFSIPAFSTNKSFYKEKGEKCRDVKIYNKSKKPFIEKPGDWICCRCKNLNFAFRTSYNRCHLTKSGSQKFFQ